jgi:hypothetical protein
MPDYGASAVAVVAISAFNVILFAIIRLSFAHGRKRYAMFAANSR